MLKLSKDSFNQNKIAILTAVLTYLALPRLLENIIQRQGAQFLKVFKLLISGSFTV